MQTPTIVLSPPKSAVSAAGGHLDVLVRVQGTDLPEIQITYLKGEDGATRSKR